MKNITLYGVEPSPYVRKVRLALAFKGIAYEQVSVVPFGDAQPQEFKDHSPLGKIPLLSIGDDYISDSAVILDFLEREFPTPALLPADNVAAAKALWFCEYASSVMVTALGGHLFAEMYMARAFFNREPLQSDIDLAINEEIPAIFTYLEQQLGSDYLVGNEFTMADLCVGAMLVLVKHCKQSCDAERWPKVATYIDRVHSLDIFKQLISEEQNILRSYGIAL